MKKANSGHSRRDFLVKCGLGTVPMLLPTIGANAMATPPSQSNTAAKQVNVNFVADGRLLSPGEYADMLRDINQLSPIGMDFYGNGGATKALEETFARITGKERAIFLPTGTMANQLAIRLLNGHNTKVMVPENSHVYRDEADAAQRVHGKRLIPVGDAKHWFDVSELKTVIDYTDANEVFKSGLGTVVIENPVRRADGRAVPLQTIKEIRDYCKQQGYRMHLDGARIHIASAYTGVSIADYASCFDTVYISLYKYLHAGAGAILCGDAALIEQVAGLIKIHGGTQYQNWMNTAMALHHLAGLPERWNQVLAASRQLMAGLNKLDTVKIEALENGTNIHKMTLAAGIDSKKFGEYLFREHNIRIGRANSERVIQFVMNESILLKKPEELLEAIEKGLEQAG
jgi:threonine aldolase